MDKNKQLLEVTLMAQNEENVSQLYKAYANKFPDWKDFWLSLAEEEIEHADWIKKLYDTAKKGSLYIDENRFSIESIKQFIAYSEERLNEAIEGKITLKKALSVAYDIEHSLIEKQFFPIFNGDSEELKDTLHKLEVAISHHRVKVKEVIDSLEKI